MAIEIIQPGKPQNKAHVNCRYCGCEFTCEREDVWWDRILVEYRVECPTCKEDIFAATSDFWED